MKKQYILIVIACLLASGLLVSGMPGSVVSAKNDNADNDVKMKVFVHYPKPDSDDGKPQRPVCQLTADDGANNYGVTGWKLPTETVVFRINYNTKPVSITNPSLTLAINKAFQAWATSGLSFIEGPASSITRSQYDGVNLVAWGSVPNNAIGITYTWYYPDTGQWLESDTILNRKLKWSAIEYAGDCSGITGAYDVQNIMTHENGHWVGLDDLYNTESKDLTMYGYGVTKEQKKDTLGWGDILGVRAIYSILP